MAEHDWGFTQPSRKQPPIHAASVLVRGFTMSMGLRKALSSISRCFCGHDTRASAYRRARVTLFAIARMRSCSQIFTCRQSTWRPAWRKTPWGVRDRLHRASQVGDTRGASNPPTNNSTNNIFHHWDLDHLDPRRGASPIQRKSSRTLTPNATSSTATFHIRHRGSPWAERRPACSPRSRALRRSWDPYRLR